MKVGEDVVLESSRDELGQKSTEAGEDSKNFLHMMVCKRIDVLYVSKYTYLFFLLFNVDILKNYFICISYYLFTHFVHYVNIYIDYIC